MTEASSPEDADQPESDEEFDFEAEYDFSDWSELPEEERSKLLKGIEALIPDIVKRTMGSVLMSDEGIRSLVADKKLPKEVVGFLLGQVDATRRGILRIVSNEVRVFLENVDFGGELAKILTTLSFEVRTEVRFIPNEERVVPQIRNRVRVKKADGTSESLGEGSEAADLSEASEALSEAHDDVEPAAPKKSSRWTRRKRSETT